jgi:hypothetical protein
MDVPLDNASRRIFCAIWFVLPRRPNWAWPPLRMILRMTTMVVVDHDRHYTHKAVAVVEVDTLHRLDDDHHHHHHVGVVVEDDPNTVVNANHCTWVVAGVHWHHHNDNRRVVVVVPNDDIAVVQW